MSDKDRFLAVLCINIIVAVTELSVGESRESLSLASDGFHCFLHVFTALVGLVSAVGFLGYSEELVEKWAFRINVSMFFPLAFFIAWEAFQKILSPSEILLDSIFFEVAIGGLLANLITALLLSGKNVSINRRAVYRHMFYDAINSLIVILGALVMLYKGGWYFLDPIASFILAIIIIKGAVEIAHSTEHEHV